MRLSHRLLFASLLALVVVAPARATTRSAAKPAGCSALAKGWKGQVAGEKIKPTHPAVERRVIVLVNRFRRRHGVRPLKLDPGLRYAARARGVIDKRLTARLALYSPSRCIAESVVRRSGLSRATAIVRSWRTDRDTRRVLLLWWVRRIGVGIRLGTFKGERSTIATADFSAARPRTRPVTTRRPRPASPVLSVTAPAPTPMPTSLPPVTVAPPVPNGPVVGVPYTCDGPVQGVRVVGTGSDARSLVNLAAGCTGTISFDIHVTSGGGDGVKVQPGVHDLTVGPSRIVCDRLTDTSFHQDGVQVQGGSNVLFSGLSVVCPYVSGQGAAGFYIDGKDFSGISNVVCDGCDLEHLHYGAMFTGPAPGSGVRNSIIHQGALTGGYFVELTQNPRGLIPIAAAGGQHVQHVIALHLLERAKRAAADRGGPMARPAEEAPASTPTGARTSDGRCSGPMTSCSARSMARSSTFWSSRMLPGQSYARRRRCASGSTATGPRPCRAASSRRKWSIRSGMSCRRARSGGRVSVTTLSR